MGDVVFSILGITLAIGGVALAVGRAVLIWRHGSHRRTSARLASLATLTLALFLLALMLLLILQPGPLRHPWLQVLLVLIGLTALTAIAAWLSKLRELRQARKTARELGLPVPRRLLHPGVIAGLWFVGSMLTMAAVTYVWAAGVDRRVAASELTAAQVDEMARLHVAWLLAGWTAAILTAAGHVTLQVYRRRREAARLDAELRRAVAKHDADHD